MRKLAIRMFVPSVRSDWNNGNAHFLRGLIRGLVALGHDVICYEPPNGWSYENLLAAEGDAGRAAVAQFTSTYPEIRVEVYGTDTLGETVAPALRDCDIVIVHEWNSPLLVDSLLSLRERFGFRMLFHDTHHRVSSSPDHIRELQVNRFDGLIVFGEVLRAIYGDRFGIARTYTLHEAADTTVFRPYKSPKLVDVLWIGNWGDEERSRELFEFLVEPARALPQAKFAVHGVRYPQQGLDALSSAGIDFRGYLPNLCAPYAYAQSAVTLHVPRRQYAAALPGIPTIRVFEALACGIPLICSPWNDAENLFPEGSFVHVRDAREMKQTIYDLITNEDRRDQIAEFGVSLIQQHHTCHHRAEQLTAICEEILS